MTMKRHMTLRLGAVPGLSRRPLGTKRRSAYHTLALRQAIFIASALVACQGFTGSTPLPTRASGTPSSSVPSRSPTLPPNSERYGLIVGTSLRSEADPRTLGEIAGGPFNGSVSPDGRRVAYWETALGGGEARVLWLLETSASSQPRILLTLPPTQTATVSTGGGVVWSNDGSGLLFGVNSRTPTPGPADGPALYASLRTIDVPSGAMREVVRNPQGLPLRPVAFDRANALATAVEVGGGGYVASYVVAREGSAPIITQLGTDIVPAVAAPDATFALAVRLRPASVLVWPLAEPERRTTMEVSAGVSVSKALWRNSREIVVLIDGDVPAARRLEVWPLEGPRRVVLRDASDLSAVRADGTAAIVDGKVVDLETGATWPIPGLTGRVEASLVLR